MFYNLKMLKPTPRIITPYKQPVVVIDLAHTDGFAVTDGGLAGFVDYLSRGKHEGLEPLNPNRLRVAGFVANLIGFPVDSRNGAILTIKDAQPNNHGKKRKMRATVDFASFQDTNSDGSTARTSIVTIHSPTTSIEESVDPLHKGIIGQKRESGSFKPPLSIFYGVDVDYMRLPLTGSMRIAETVDQAGLRVTRFSALCDNDCGEKVWQQLPTDAGALQSFGQTIISATFATKKITPDNIAFMEPAGILAQLKPGV
jgi:hypothetical protein